ncbi:MAG: hypothetical protein JRG91_07020 [Deltaproteobacteria bacterium]|nr:hypothetical protein [Deltaproteobacteria bacterium]
MVALQSHFETYGTKMIWLLAWDGGTTPTNAMAQTFYESHGTSFGWYTDDRDNSVEAYLFHNSDMAGGVPWVGVIDAKTMRVAADNPSDVRSLVQSLGSD